VRREDYFLTRGRGKRYLTQQWRREVSNPAVEEGGKYLTRQLG